MRRRDFVVAIGGSAAAWPLKVRAQQRAVPVIGYQTATSAIQSSALRSRAAFVQGLSEQGFVDGRNVTVLYRYAGP